MLQTYGLSHCVNSQVAFFTEIPQIESVHSMTVAKVLSISRTAFNAVSASFPIGARTVLENLGELADTVRVAISPIV